MNARILGIRYARIAGRKQGKAWRKQGNVCMKSSRELRKKVFNKSSKILVKGM